VAGANWGVPRRSRHSLRPARSGGNAPDAGAAPADVTPAVTDREDEDRRTNHALRHRIDQLIDRVRAAEEEIVERGLDAVQETKEHDAEGPSRRLPPAPGKGRA